MWLQAIKDRDALRDSAFFAGKPAPRRAQRIRKGPPGNIRPPFGKQLKLCLVRPKVTIVGSVAITL
jgi:hypothetical protein